MEQGSGPSRLCHRRIHWIYGSGSVVKRRSVTVIPGGRAGGWCGESPPPSVTLVDVPGMALMPEWFIPELSLLLLPQAARTIAAVAAVRGKRH